MGQFINTNAMSLVAQNNLNSSQGVLGTAIERLSSGLRINSAKDDAAGQSIANRFTSNIKGLTQAARNANDGISIAQTTEGALTEINNNVQRIRELSVQAANGSNSPDDIKSIQAEITQRLNEITRVSEQTDFNGRKVLSSTAGSLEIQVGAKDGETITINLREMSSETLGLDGFTVAGFRASDAGLTAGAATAETAAKMGSVDNGAGEMVAVKEGDTINLPAVDPAQGEELVSYKDADGKTQYAMRTTDEATGESTYKAMKVTYTAGATANDPATIDIAEDTGVTLNAEDFASTDPLATLDKAIDKIADLRGELGAVQNRFKSTIANLNNTINNLSEARSRIEDADYATEVSNMTRGQILQQAGTSVLAQANQSTQTVLSLLR